MPESQEQENMRREAVNIINAVEGSREYLEQKYGQVWDTTQLQEDYIAVGFMAPFIIVKRKSDSVKGMLMFQHSPRFYWGFEAC